MTMTIRPYSLIRYYYLAFFLALCSVHSIEMSDSINIFKPDNDPPPDLPEHDWFQKCVECVASNKSWQEGYCLEGHWPLTHLRNCYTIECCATDGCRSTDDSYWIATLTGLHKIPCKVCCEKLETNGCLEWFSDSDESSWYDSVEDILACPEDRKDYTVENYCPPCAPCSERDESRLLELSEQTLDEVCTEERCEREALIRYFQDPCIPTPDSCACWCQKVNEFIDNCPHLRDTLFPSQNVATPIPTANSSLTFPSASAAPSNNETNV